MLLSLREAAGGGVEVFAAEQYPGGLTTGEFEHQHG